MRTRLLAQSTLGLAFILATPSVVHAYSLGEIRVTSHLGEAFYAEIPLHLREGEGVKDFVASLANQEEYLVLELHRSPVIIQLDAKINIDVRGPRIVLKSQSNIQEPFFNLLVKTTMGSGSFFRNFPVFLDMKMVSMAATSKRPAQQAPAVVQDFSPALRKEKPKAAPSIQLGAVGEYGPVRRGDNLINIAKRLQGQYPGLSENQLAAVLWHRNPEAFVRGNINALRAGAMLNLPEPTEASKLSPQETQEIFAQQYREWRGEGLTHPQPTRQGAPKEAPTPPVKPVPEDKTSLVSTLPPGEARRPSGKPQTTEQTASEPPKPKISTDTAAPDKKVAFDQRVVMHTGETPTSAAPVVTSAPVVTPEVAAPIATPTDVAATEALSLQLTKSLSRLDTLESKLGETTTALQSSEKARGTLQSSLVTLQQRMEQLEKSRAESTWNLQDILLYAGGGLGVLLLGGILALLSRRRKPAVLAPPSAAGAPPPPANHMGLAMAAGVAAGAVASMAMAADNEEQDTTVEEEEEQITSFSPNDYTEEEEEAPSVEKSAPVREPVSLKKEEQPTFGGEEEPSWQKAMGMEEDGGAYNSASELDLDNAPSDMDLDAFAASTVIGMEDEDVFGDGGESSGALNLDDSLAESEGDLSNLGVKSVFSLGQSTARPTTSESNQGVEELDFSTMDSLSGGDNNRLELPSLGDEDEDVGGLFLPGASFDEDEEGTLEAIPLSRGAGAPSRLPTTMEFDGLESIDVESLGLDEEAESHSVDMDLDSPGLSLGNLDDNRVSLPASKAEPIKVPAFEMVELDFEEKDKPVKLAKKLPSVNTFELTTIDFDLDDDVNK